jgi:hypothetical protein
MAAAVSSEIMIIIYNTTRYNSPEYILTLTDVRNSVNPVNVLHCVQMQNGDSSKTLIFFFVVLVQSDLNREWVSFDNYDKLFFYTA